MNILFQLATAVSNLRRQTSMDQDEDDAIEAPSTPLDEDDAWMKMIGGWKLLLLPLLLFQREKRLKAKVTI